MPSTVKLPTVLSTPARQDAIERYNKYSAICQERHKQLITDGDQESALITEWLLSMWANETKAVSSPYSFDNWTQKHQVHDTLMSEFEDNFKRTRRVVSDRLLRLHNASPLRPSELLIKENNVVCTLAQLQGNTEPTTTTKLAVSFTLQYGVPVTIPWDDTMYILTMDDNDMVQVETVEIINCTAAQLHSIEGSGILWYPSLRQPGTREAEVTLYFDQKPTL